MNPTYICVNGHTFDQPVVGNKIGPLGKLSVFACPTCHTDDFEMAPRIIEPTYVCINGHTFARPLVSDKMGVLDSPSIVYGCPECYTANFEKIPTLEELEEKEPTAKTYVTRLGKSIRGGMMISFKCHLCACEFESPISECSLSINGAAIMHYTVTGVKFTSSPVANHKCPAPYCGVECEVVLNEEDIFEEETE